MKCVIAFSCLLAVASAGYLNSAVGYGAYDDGSYKGEAFNHGVYGGAYSGALGYASHGSHAVAYNAPIVSAPHAVGHAYAGPYAHGYAHAASVAVAHSGSHAVAYNAPLVSAHHPVNIGYAGPLAHAYAAHTGPVAHGYAHGYAHATPVAHGYAHGYAHATPVAHGYAHGYAHAAPIAHAYAHAAPLGLASETRLIDPVAIAAGAPLPTGDTVEVAAAKAFHHQAHVEAKAGHLHAKGHYLVKRSPGYLNAGYAGYAAPLAYAAAPAYVYSHGVSAYASPLAYSGYSGYGYGGHLGAYYG